MNTILEKAGEVAKLFGEAKISAIVAETLLMEMGFAEIRFPQRGALITAKYLGITYNL